MNMLKKLWSSIATRFIPQPLATSYRKKNTTNDVDIVSGLNKLYYFDNNKDRIYNNGTDSWFWKYVSIETRKSRNLSDIGIGISLLVLGIAIGRLIWVII